MSSACQADPGPIGPARTIPFPGPDGIPLPALLRQAVADRMAFDPKGERVQLQSNVSVEEAEVLYRVVRETVPEHSLEIGLAQGISTLAILQALDHNHAGTHHVIDPFQHRFGNVGLAMVARAGLGQRFDFHHRFPEEVISGLPRLKFVFIDSSHLFDLTLLEFVLADKRLEPGGVMAFHDLWMPSVQGVAGYILANRAYERLAPAPRLKATRPPWRLRCRRWLAGLMRTMPGSSGMFRPSFLNPGAFASSNLLFLRKQGEDRRDWQFHEPF